MDVIPHSPEAESAVIAAAILDSSAIPRLSKIVRVDDFHLSRNGLVWRALLRLYEAQTAVDLVTLKDDMAAHNELDAAGGIARIAQAVSDLPTASNADDYARIVRRFALRRALLKRVVDAAKMIANGSPPNGELDELAQAGKALADASLSAVPEGESALDLMARELSPLEYVLAPLASVGNLTLLQGEPKGGKSTFALLVAICASLGVWPCGRFVADGKPRMTLYLGWEDGRRRFKRRISQYARGIGDELHPVSLTHLVVYPSDIAPRIRLDTPEGSSLLKSIITRHGAKLVVLDTLSHLTAGDENSKKEMQPVMDALKDIARECECAIIVLHHTGKPSKDSKKSVVMKGRGSSTIAAAADVILDWGDRAGTNITPCSLISKDDDGDRFDVEYLPDGDDIVRWRLVDHQDEADDKYGSRKAIIESIGKLIATCPLGVPRDYVTKDTGLTRNTVIRHLTDLAKEGSIQARQIDGEHGQKWVYAPITHVF